MMKRTIYSHYIFLGILASSIITTPAFAQTDIGTSAPPMPDTFQGGHRSSHHDSFMRSIHAVNLSDDQKLKIQAITEQFRQAHPAGNQPSADDRAAYHQKILDILTPEQRNQIHQ